MNCRQFCCPRPETATSERAFLRPQLRGKDAVSQNKFVLRLWASGWCAEGLILSRPSHRKIGITHSTRATFLILHEIPGLDVPLVRRRCSSSLSSILFSV